MSKLPHYEHDQDMMVWYGGTIHQWCLCLTLLSLSFYFSDHAIKEFQFFNWNFLCSIFISAQEGECFHAGYRLRGGSNWQFNCWRSWSITGNYIKKYEDLINYLSHKWNKVHPESLSLSRWLQWLVACVNRWRNSVTSHLLLMRKRVVPPLF